MHLGFRARVLLAIAAIAVCASLSIGIISIHRSTQDVEDNYIQAMWKTLSVALSSFDENARAAYETAVSLSCDDTLTALIAHYDGTDATAALRISAYLSAQRRVDNLRHMYVYLPAQGQVVTSTEYHAVQEMARVRTPWLRDAVSGLPPQLVYDSVARVPEYMLCYTIPMENGTSVSVNLDERRLFYQYLGDLNTGGGDAYYLLTPDGRIASANALPDVGRRFSDVSGITRPPVGDGRNAEAFTDGSSRLIAAVRSPMTGYTLVAISDRMALTASLRGQRNFFGGMLALVLLAMLVPAYYMSGHVYAPVGKLRDAMRRVSEGDLSARAAVSTADEIGQLAEGFNEMVSRIEGLIGDLVSEQMQKKEAELEALQYQITPHFMYNTLNSIKYAAVLQGNEQVGEQLSAFIELLQASISRTGAFLTVRDETRLVQNYVRLQQFRYGNSFNVTYDLSPDAAPYYVPRLILQPLVENAVLHGQSRSSGLCEITVSTALHCSLAGNFLILSVQDAGDGMTREQMQRLTTGKKTSRSGLSGIGVPNIIERLRLYYGDSASLQFSGGELGTKATIILPASRDADAYTI